MVEDDDLLDDFSAALSPRAESPHDQSPRAPPTAADTLDELRLQLQALRNDEISLQDTVDAEGSHRAVLLDDSRAKSLERVRLCKKALKAQIRSASAVAKALKSGTHDANYMATLETCIDAIFVHTDELFVLCSNDSEIGQLVQAVDDARSGWSKFVSLDESKRPQEAVVFGATLKVLLATASATCSRAIVSAELSTRDAAAIPAVDSELIEMLATGM